MCTVKTRHFQYKLCTIKSIVKRLYYSVHGLRGSVISAIVIIVAVGIIIAVTKRLPAPQ